MARPKKQPIPFDDLPHDEQVKLLRQKIEGLEGELQNLKGNHEDLQNELQGALNDARKEIRMLNEVIKCKDRVEEKNREKYIAVRMALKAVL